MTWRQANEILDTLSRDDALAPERKSAPQAPPLSTVNVRIDAQSVKYHARKYRCDNPHKANGSHPVGSLARAAGVSAAQLTGEALTPLYKVETLADLLGCTADDLIETAEGKRMNPTPWTEEHDQLLIENQHLGRNGVAELTGRTPSSVTNRAHYLKTHFGHEISLEVRDPEPKAPAPESQPDAALTPADTSVDTGRCTDDCANEPCEGHCTDPEHFTEVAGEDPEEPSEVAGETHSLDEAVAIATEAARRRNPELIILDEDTGLMLELIHTKLDLLRHIVLGDDFDSFDVDPIFSRIRELVGQLR